MITLFTPTYNRGYILPNLYKSLQNQTCFDFEWLVIDDGSTDNTAELFDHWCKVSNRFAIRYVKVKNGGKQRAINRALEMAEGKYFFIIDSDDVILPDTVSFINEAFDSLPADSSFIGISGVRGRFDNHQPLNKSPLIDPSKGFIDASNLERSKYGLEADMAEAFYTEKLKAYRFPVWKGESFTPEAVVWDQLALDGYKLRWFNKVIYLCEYREDGLTNSSWKLLKNNPMGYAMLFNIQLKYQSHFKEKFRLTLLFIASCCLAHEYHYIQQCSEKGLSYLLFPLGWLLSVRRKRQFKKYCS